MSLFRRRTRARHGERGQVLVLFTISAVAIIAMVGLVIDGGWTFVQRRDQQNVADAAAMAGGYAYVNNNYVSSYAVNAALANAAANGYVDGVDGVSVTVDVSGASIVVNVTKPHQNFFSGIVGFSSWNVGATATVKAGVPNQAVGPLPVIFNRKAISPPYGFGQGNERWFGEPGSGNADVPSGPSQFNWTVFCTANGNSCNANSNQVDALINGVNTNPQHIDTSSVIGPLNAGAHTTLFSDLAAYVGTADPCFPVAIVDDGGTFQGLAQFCLTASVGGSTKQIRGYFQGPITDTSFDIIPGAPSGNSTYGLYVVRLTN